MTDPVWGRPLYVSPVQGRSTWGVNEVLLGEHGGEHGGGVGRLTERITVNEAAHG